MFDFRGYQVVLFGLCGGFLGSCSLSVLRSLKMDEETEQAVEILELDSKSFAIGARAVMTGVE